MIARVTILLAVLAAPFMAARGARAAVMYQITDLGTLPGLTDNSVGMQSPGGRRWLSCLPTPANADCQSPDAAAR